MTTTETKREWDVAEVVRLQDKINPDTGRFYSLPQIAELLDINVSKTALSKGAREYRHEHQMGQPGILADKLLPWELPAHLRADYNTVRLRWWAHDAKKDQLDAKDQGYLDAYKRMLKRMGPETVVGFDPDARNGQGGFFYRQRKPREPTVYGLMLPAGSAKV